MKKRSALGWIVLILLVVGGLNLGLIGLGLGNVLAALGAQLEQIVNVLIGVAALIKIYWVVKK